MSVIVLRVIVNVLQTASNIYVLLVIFNVFLPYFVSPDNPFRRVIDSLVNPLLNLLRRYVPPIGRFDFTPVVLVILVQLVTYLLIALLANLVR